MALKLHIKNLNVSKLDKSFSKELNKFDQTTNVQAVVNAIVEDLQLTNLNIGIYLDTWIECIFINV